MLITLNRDASTGVALYMQLARLLRARIMEGEWRYGTVLPPIPLLCESYEVGTVTVRQALKLLAAEGLVTVERGRGTTVRKMILPTSEDASLRQTISDPLELGPAQVLDVLVRERVRSLPAALASGGKPLGEYVRILKTQSYQREVFSLNELFVVESAFERFPPGADTKQKVAWLMREHGNIKLNAVRQQLTVVSADPDTAKLMNLQASDYSLSGTLIRTLKWWVDDKKRIALAGIHLYRADRYILDITQEVPDFSSALSASLVPTAAPVKRKPGNGKN